MLCGMEKIVFELILIIFVWVLWAILYLCIEWSVVSFMRVVNDFSLCLWPWIKFFPSPNDALFDMRKKELV